MSASVATETVLVTGGASGIGFAIVKAVLDEGWRAVIADLGAENLERSRDAIGDREGRVRFVRLDVTDEAAATEAIDACEAEFGAITGLVNSAGIGRDVPLMETSVALFRKMLDVNLIGSFVMAREAARRMQTRGAGSIVNIASVSGMRGNVGRTAYGASKGGVILMTQVMAVELAAHGIRVNAIAPGPIETPLVREMHTAESRADWIDATPQRRYGDPADVASAALFLLDRRKSGFVTGQTLVVDGGFTAGGLLARSVAAAARGAQAS